MDLREKAKLGRVEGRQEAWPALEREGEGGLALAENGHREDGEI